MDRLAGLMDDFRKDDEGLHEVLVLGLDASELPAKVFDHFVPGLVMECVLPVNEEIGTLLVLVVAVFLLHSLVHPPPLPLHTLFDPVPFTEIVPEFPEHGHEVLAFHFVLVGPVMLNQIGGQHLLVYFSVLAFPIAVVLEC